MQALKIKILDKRLQQPEYKLEYATAGAAGIDLRASIDQPMVINPGQTILVPAGFAMHLDNSGYMAMLAPRSGLGSRRGIVLGNLVGIIDSDYQDEVRVAIWNRSDQPYEIQPMERIAQMMIVPVAQVRLEVVDEFDATTERTRAGESHANKGGFGSTGRV